MRFSLHTFSAYIYMFLLLLRMWLACQFFYSYEWECSDENRIEMVIKQLHFVIKTDHLFERLNLLVLEDINSPLR